MSKRSHVDIDKIDRVPSGQPFVYKDVVQDGFTDDQVERTIDGRMFKDEVERGMYASVKPEKNNETRMLYRKL